MITSFATTTNTTDLAALGVSNPKGVLKSEDFLKLLLTELKYQDPTQPMDTQTMLTQTSQLAQLEASTTTKTTLDNLSKTMTLGQTYALAGAIGRMADTGSKGVVLQDGRPVSFALFNPVQAASGSVVIKGSDGGVVRTFDMANQKAGTVVFDWDGRDANGNKMEDGLYMIEGTVADANGAIYTLKYGALPISSVRFGKSEPELKLGNDYIALSKIKEIY
ncbi:MAG: flagellar hook capping protein [Campylobacterales bacterium]